MKAKKYVTVVGVTLMITAVHFLFCCMASFFEEDRARVGDCEPPDPPMTSPGI